MRLFVVGDIHGDDKKFRAALKSVSLKKTDKLILIGDLIDRGRDSKGVLDSLTLLKSNGFDNIVYIRGNHEQMLLDAFKDPDKEYIWLKNGGDKTLLSFKVNFCDQIPKEYISLIESSVFYHQHNDYIFVHAGIDFKLDDPLSDAKSLMWTREINETAFENSAFAGKKIVHGHTPVSRSVITHSLQRSSIINVDNGVYMKNNDFGSLSIVNLDTMKANFI
ncbi:metallophosphoesterase family protein [Sphingobacterium deserti]|uniref:Serine/threonine specific protein phosphatase n=1 Tax=Sphingobacterium deserti TaxID=1229276 RepID=A0A0B8TCF5_9SPHI|nr:metallophosphoesterase family protein [Sphingobacterium deserti]KGE16080.1 serine/threonine specific protein phosphatase [Sphingobacterium deserti]